MSDDLRPGVWPEIPAGRFASTLLDTPDAADVVLIGLPDDTGVKLNGGRPGAAEGPTAFRAALARMGVADPHGFTWPKVYDAGDVPPAGSLHETHDRITAVVRSLCAPNRIMVAIGGGHDLTFPFVRGVAHAEGQPLAGAYLDPHLDVREEDGSGMPFRRLIEGGFVESIQCCGAEDRVNSHAHRDWFVSNGGRITGPRLEFPEWGTRPCFTSLDLDAVEAAHAPGVSAPNPHGFAIHNANQFAWDSGQQPGLRCFDIMELSPPHDEGGRTARLAASLFLDFLESLAVRERQDKICSGTKPVFQRLIRNGRVLTLGAPGVRRGSAMRDLSVLKRADIRIVDGIVTEIGVDLDAPDRTDVIEAEGGVVMPGFVDCHTHACWAGSRIAEWESMLAGKSYLEILEQGGGIMATVRAVRAATEGMLTDSLWERVDAIEQEGTTTLEIKSGYGLTTEDELKMLRAIIRAGDDSFVTVVPTACIGHAIDPELGPQASIRRTIDETLPAVHAEFPGIAIDAFCEKSAWPMDACLELFEKAAELGHPCRVHADQFTSMGLIEEAARRGFVSVDHLEASSAETLRTLAESDTIGVVLPCSGFHLDQRYADARTLIDAGGAVAIATNWNPGSAPCGSIPAAMALAARHCGVLPAEAISAVTANAAAVLGLGDRGALSVGARADIVVLDSPDERALCYELCGRRPAMVFCGGVLV